MATPAGPEKVTIQNYFKVPRPEDPAKFNVMVAVKLPDGSLTSFTIKEEEFTEDKVLELARKEWDERKKWVGKELTL